MAKNILHFIIVLFILGLGGIYTVNAQSADTDGDGIFDDGDNSGVVGDHLCSGGNTTSCDDNCVNVYNPEQIDSDGDGAGNACEDNALDFSGAVNSRVLVTGAGLPDIGNKEITIEAWVKSKTSNLTGGIFTVYSGVVSAGLEVNNNEPRFNIQIVSGHPTSTAASGGSILSNLWYHIAGVLTNSLHSHPQSANCTAAVMAQTPHMDIYVNGEFRDCATTGSKFINTPAVANDMSIGWLNGEIDEVRLWTVARTQQEIQECMNNKLGSVSQCQIDPAKLKGYWRLDEGMGTTAMDSSGNGYSGNILSGSWTAWSGGWTGGYPFGGLDADMDSDGYTMREGDCNDNDASVKPGVADICDGKDNDCNFGTPDGNVESWYGNACDGPDTDLCMEGVLTCANGIQSCTDSTGSTVEVCDGVDNDCDGVADNLIQTTTCGVGQCSGNSGIETCLNGDWVNNTCDSFAGATAEICDNTDNDCDGVVDEGLVNMTRCGVGACFGNSGDITCIAGSWVNNTCDPLLGAVPEIPANGIDDDCNLLTYDTPVGIDGDGDGYSKLQGDCDDTNAGVNPVMTEITGNFIDDDCNPLTYDSSPATDDDGDGYAESSGIIVNSSRAFNMFAPSINNTNLRDCDDTNAAVFPGAAEMPVNGLDDDCDPLTYDSPLNTDDDGDGYSEIQGDCDDTNPAVNSNAREMLNNGKDDDCNPLTIDSNSDTDGDGIAEDGDNSGVVKDNPCTGGNTTNCDDNCSQTFNPGQQDTNGDGYGNICDADLDNDGVVGYKDFNVFKAAWLSTTSSPNWDPDADLDSDNVVGYKDFNVFKGRWLTIEPWY